jgi:hypothetical protein
MNPYLGENRIYTCPVTGLVHDPLYTRHLLMVHSRGKLWGALKRRDEAATKLADPELPEPEVEAAEAMHAVVIGDLVKWTKAAGLVLEDQDHTWGETLHILDGFLDWLDQKKSPSNISPTSSTLTIFAPAP